MNWFTQLAACPLPRIEDQVAELSKCEEFNTLSLKPANSQEPIPDEVKYSRLHGV